MRPAGGANDALAAAMPMATAAPPARIAAVTAAVRGPLGGSAARAAHGITGTANAPTTDDGIDAAAATAASDSRAARLQRRVAEERQLYNEARAERLAAEPVVEDLGELGRAMDGARWRRRVGLEPGAKVFVMTGWYPDLRDALFRRGWKQNADFASPHFDLAFTLKPSEVNHRTLRPGQAANHFAKASALTTKAGLCHTLRAAHWFAPVDINAFFPRAYDLADPADYADFADDFRAVEAEKVVRTVVIRVLDAALAAGEVSAAQLRLGGPAAVAPTAAAAAAPDGAPASGGAQGPATRP
jgi:hypothetical protein